jgi:cellulose synthase/poly-beta-1,6-N-acetylglucosamine synthase-like glycosyltransferase
MLTVTLATITLLLIGWVGYPVVIALLGARARRRTPPAAPPVSPPAAVIIATRDAPLAMQRRVADILKSTYRRDRLQVIVAVDARSPYAISDYMSCLAHRARVVPGDLPGGKALTLNAGVRAADASILVFADSQQRFDPEAISELVCFLTQPEFGAVSGALVQQSGDGAMDLFWRYELLIRRGQSAINSIVSTSGGIQAVRSDLWMPLPANLICDDLYTTMQIVRRGLRVGFCPTATAFDPRQFTRIQQFQRKVRTLTGLFQFISWVPEVLLPWRNPIWTHFACHKLLRLATPYLVLLALIGLGQLLWQALDGALLAAVGVGLAAGVAAGMAMPSWRRSVLGHAGWAGLMLAAPVAATVNGVRRKWRVWHHHEPLQQAWAGKVGTPDVSGAGLTRQARPPRQRQRVGNAP